MTNTLAKLSNLLATAEKLEGGGTDASGRPRIIVTAKDGRMHEIKAPLPTKEMAKMTTDWEKLSQKAEADLEKFLNDYAA